MVFYFSDSDITIHDVAYCLYKIILWDIKYTK